MCAYDSSEWRLTLDLEPAMIDGVLDSLTRYGPEFAEIVAAARDPESPAGRARRTAIENESQDDQDDEPGAALASATEPSNPLVEADLQASRSVEKAAGVVHGGVVADTGDDVPEPFYRGEPEDCPNGNEHRLTSWATYTAADGLTIKVLDSAEWPCEDLEYTYHVTTGDIGPLCAALGAEGSEDLLATVARRYKNGTMPTLALGTWLKEHGVEYSASETRHPN